MVVSLKANKKRILAFLILAVIVVGAVVFLRAGGGEEAQPLDLSAGTNEERVAFLESFGWKVGAEPAETREVMIPAQFNDVYTTYNVMQKAQGFDLKPYAGEICTQYKYKIDNYPGETEVYATLLVYGEKIIGGDLACAKMNGFMHGFARDSARYGETSGTKKAAEKEESEPVSSAPESSSQPEDDPERPAEAETAAEPEEDAEETAAEPDPEEDAEETAGEVIPEEAYPTD